jgi:hypothetical protein
MPIVRQESAILPVFPASLSPSGENGAQDKKVINVTIAQLPAAGPLRLTRISNGQEQA